MSCGVLDVGLRAFLPRADKPQELLGGALGNSPKKARKSLQGVFPAES